MKPACHNRPHYQSTAQAQNGWTADGRRNMIQIEDNMSKHCHQHHPATGEAVIHGWDCEGCVHKPDEMTPEQIANWERHQKAVPNAEITVRRARR